MHDFSRFLEECEQGPRLNELAEFFSSTAAGRSGMPLRRPRADRRLLPRDRLLKRFLALHEQRQGPFDQHYLSSIPYRFEEECRLGCAILRYAESRPGALTFYSLGTAEATMARTVSELSGGKVKSLSCSPTEENRTSFYAFGAPENASFFLGPFHRLTSEELRKRPEASGFADGFDIILEDTTFQMYSPNRREQIAFVARHLKPDGVFLFVEKFRHESEAEYRSREFQKDFGFKARFFSQDEIESKEQTVLARMNENEVTLEQMSEVLQRMFVHCFVTWNSGNFYTLAASNNASNIKRFVSSLGEAALPMEYVYEELPRRLYQTKMDEDR